MPYQLKNCALVSSYFSGIGQESTCEEYDTYSLLGAHLFDSIEMSKVIPCYPPDLYFVRNPMLLNSFSQVSCHRQAPQDVRGELQGGN